MNLPLPQKSFSFSASQTSYHRQCIKCHLIVEMIFEMLKLCEFQQLLKVVKLEMKVLPIMCQMEKSGLPVESRNLSFQRKILEVLQSRFCVVSRYRNAKECLRMRRESIWGFTSTFLLPRRLKRPFLTTLNYPFTDT